MKVDVKQTVSQLVEAPLQAEGFELAEAVVSQYRNNVTVRLFVYGENGVSIDECARLSRMVGELIDGTDLFDDGYMLEVSSPGLERPLTSARDYRYRVGETIRVEFFDPKRKKFRGELLSAEDDRAEFRVDDETITVELAEIKSARIVF